MEAKTKNGTFMDESCVRASFDAINDDGLEGLLLVLRTLLMAMMAWLMTGLKALLMIMMAL